MKTWSTSGRILCKLSAVLRASSMYDVVTCLLVFADW